MEIEFKIIYIHYEMRSYRYLDFRLDCDYLCVHTRQNIGNFQVFLN